MNVKVVKMSGGDEVIAEILESDNDQYTEIKNPVTVQMTSGGLAFVPWIMFATQESQEHLRIHNSHVVIVLDVGDQKIRNTYKEIFGTGVIEVQKPRLVLP